MKAISEIEAVLPDLSSDELRHIEAVIRQLYRERKEPVIYDDDYGLWTEQDQAFAASQVFELMDRVAEGE